MAADQAALPAHNLDSALAWTNRDDAQCTAQCAVIKGISNDFFDVETYVPEKVDSFSLSLRVRIGLDCTQGADDFELFICTPKWLEETVWEPYWGRGLLIVREYNFSTIKGLIHEYASRCDGDSWEIIVVKLGKLFSWEFDDYQS